MLRERRVPGGSSQPAAVARPAKRHKFSLAQSRYPDKTARDVDDAAEFERWRAEREKEIAVWANGVGRGERWDVDRSASERKAIWDQLAIAQGAPLDRTDPFTGSAAAGIHPATMPLTLDEKVNLWDSKRVKEEGAHQQSWWSKALFGPNTDKSVDQAWDNLQQYSNPASFLFGRSANPWFYDAVRKKQKPNGENLARLMLLQPIVTGFPGAYQGTLPTRRDVVLKAATSYGVPPMFLAAVIMNEQWDQSQNEDRAEFWAAFDHGKNTSIGLGQVMVSTAFRKNLLTDVIHSSDITASVPYLDPPDASQGLPNAAQSQKLAWCLASEELNIIATAKYLRFMVDSIPSVDWFYTTYPAVTPAAVAEAKRGGRWEWNLMEAVADNYTRTPWERGRGLGGWGAMTMTRFATSMELASWNDPVAQSHTTSPSPAVSFCNNSVYYSVGMTLRHLSLSSGLFCIMAWQASGDARAERKYKVTVLSEPDGAAVYLGTRESEKACDTPCVLELPVGDYSVIFELDGYEQATESMKVKRRGKNEVWVTLQETSEAFIAIMPPEGLTVGEVKVNLDGAEVAQALPYTAKVKPGSHQIEVIAKGYKLFEQWIEAKERDRLEVIAALVPLQEDKIDPNAVKVVKKPEKPAGEGPAAPYALLSAGFELGWRKYTYDNPQTSTARDFETTAAPLVRIGAEVFPLARSRSAALRGIGLVLGGAIGKPKDIDNMGDAISLSWLEIEGGVQYLYPISKQFSAGVDAAFGHFRFAFKSAGDLSDEVPTVGYNYIRAGAKIAASFGRVRVDVGGGYHAVLKIGELGDRFQDASATGFGGRGAVGFQIVKGLYGQASGWLRRYSHSFTSDPGDAVVADGGTDMLYGFMVGAAYAL